MKLREFLTWRIYIVIIAILLAVLVIQPQFNTKGVAIKAVAAESNAASVGLLSLGQDILPSTREVITALNGQPIETLADYQSALQNIHIDEAVRIVTDKQSYDPFLKDTEDIGIVVDTVASSNIRKGLDLEGGTRVILEPVGEVTDQDVENAKDTIAHRLNVFGISDVTVRVAKDLAGNSFIVVEVAGASREDVKKLVAQQGKFEAKIGNDTVFIGGQRDIVFVCRNDGSCSGIRQCSQSGDGYICTFDFSIRLSEKAAQRHADVTKNLDVNLSSAGGQYLSKPLDLYLDDVLVDSLQISASLRGQVANLISISGPGFGPTQEEAVDGALKNMNSLQTVLITGSLPFKLDIVKIDSISPSLGAAFVKNALLAGLLALCAVMVVVAIRYRKIKIVVPMIFISATEIFLIFGLAALIKQNIDLAAIAGIIAAVGTGVDDQIIIVDEVLQGGRESSYAWKERMKRAFFIILAAYATVFAAMIPLLWAGAGLLTGFALTTIAGVSIGILITRPAFASIVEILLKE